MAIPARHALVRDEGIHGRFFHNLNGGVEKRVQSIVRNGLDGTSRLGRVGGAGIGGRKRDEQISGAVAGNTARARQTQRGAASEAFELMRQQRRVRCDHDNNGTVFLAEERVFQNLFADRDPRDGELLAQPAIGLDECADGVSRTVGPPFFMADDA